MTQNISAKSPVSRPLAPGTIIDYSGELATVFRDQGDDTIEVSIDGRIQRWRWKFEGVECSVVSSPVDAEKPLQHKIEAAVNAEKSFQERVQPWMLECFGSAIASDQKERNHRFLEESLELVQSCGCTQTEALQLVAYVYGREIGERPQEVGGAMVTLAALCLAHGMNMHECGEVELARIWTKVPQIRAKQAGKPKHSPLPEHSATSTTEASPMDLLAAENNRLSMLAETLTAKLAAAHVKLDALLAHCPDAECPTCSEIICDKGDAMHFHHDGCPSCDVLKDANNDSRID